MNNTNPETNIGVLAKDQKSKAATIEILPLPRLGRSCPQCDWRLIAQD